jgi:glycosyltransferase involved in cell wall biosynthesis
VKEADALSEAGHEVHVVAVNGVADRTKFDRRIVQDRDWTLIPVEATRSRWPSWFRWLRAGMRQKASRYLYPLFSEALRDYAYSRYLSELTTVAAARPADLHIAHNLQALPAAYRAAQQHEALLGFDAEDFHRGEFPDEDSSLSKELTQRVEAQYLPRCEHLTAASEGIAGAYAGTLGIQKPVVILNVFPLDEREGQTPPEELEKESPPDGVISLYWYSQVIGPDRGLQDALRALPHLDERVHLTLRGRWAEGFEDRFRRLARNLDVEHRLRVLPSVPPDELVERAAQHDIGLALEQGHTRNRDLCVTNKILVYLLAGRPVVATDTTGQRQICEDVPDATRLCPIGEPEAIATAVHSLTAHGDSLRRAKRAAREAGENRYNWGEEKKTLLRIVEQTLS